MYFAHGIFEQIDRHIRTVQFLLMIKYVLVMDTVIHGHMIVRNADGMVAIAQTVFLRRDTPIVQLELDYPYYLN